MNSKILSLIKSRLKKQLRDKEIIDVILFGSAVKGKALPSDVDIAVVTKKDFKLDLQGFHISVLKPEDFFSAPSLINTLLREGYSLKKDLSFSQIYKFSSRALFRYELVGLKPSIKVKIVNVLRGINEEKGLVKENGGEWLARQVFFVPVEREQVIEKFFLNFKVKFSKFFILIH